MKSHEINRATESAYRCLCRDLGYEYLPAKVDVRALNELKNALLQHLEMWPHQPAVGKSPMASINDYETQRDNVIAAFTRLFRSGRPVPRDIVDSVEFVKDTYQLVCAPLKVNSHVVTDDQEVAYLQKFVANEEHCSAYTWNDSIVSRIAKQISLSAACAIDLSFKACQAKMRDGRGAVYDRRTLDEKYLVAKLPPRVLSVYPLETWFANSGLCCYLQDNVDVSDDYDVCRMILVPKDWKGPRGVFVSQCEMMKLQLAQQALLVEAMSKTWFRFCYDPYSQSPSQELAHMGSYDRGWATLDLSDASDLISLPLVEELLPAHVCSALFAARSERIEMSNGVIREMSMFAPMGDGRTFPILTWVCAVAATAAVLASWGHNPYVGMPVRAVLERAARCVRVFGDDIAVKTEYYDATITTLGLFGLKVNVLKSYSRGFFREACGHDAFKGVDITPFRMRTLLDRRSNLDSLVESHNNAFRKGLYMYCSYLEAYVQRITRNTVAYCGVQPPGSFALCTYDRVKRLNHHLKWRWHGDYHEEQVQCSISVEPAVKPPSDSIRSAMVWYYVNSYLQRHSLRESDECTNTASAMPSKDGIVAMDEACNTRSVLVPTVLVTALVRGGGIEFGHEESRLVTRPRWRGRP